MFLCSIFISSTTCATQVELQDQDSNPRNQIIELEPTIISSVDSINIADLFERAYHHFENQEFEAAAADYNKIILVSQRGDVDKKYLLPALYNGGLSYEKINQLEDAKNCYLAIIEKNIDDSDTLDAYFRLAMVDERLKQWDEIITIMTNLLQRLKRASHDSVEAEMRLAWALMETKSYDKAMSHFQKALYINNKMTTSNRFGKYSPVIVRTNFGIGRVFQEKGERIKLKLPPERMGHDLERKAEFLLSSQSAYLRALAAHDRKWSIAAGFKIGSLYENFYNDILSSEIPKGLNPDALSLYFKELRKQIKPLVERAGRIYNKTVALSKRMGNPIDSLQWSQTAKDSLQHMNKYIMDPATQQRAERFVLRGWPLNYMFIPKMIILDAIAYAKTATDNKEHKNTNKNSPAKSK